jgi:dTDP-4-amino-4,6-dideoxygalactose transaminase
MPTFEEYCEEIKGLWETHWLTNMGAKHKRLETDLLAYLGSDHVKLYCNGHLALENILEAYAFPKGSEVITTPFTFASTTHSIVRSGLTPVMCDINPVDYTIDVDKIEELITDNTVAIMPVHVYGNLCDVERVKAIADKHNLKVIYDAAHAFAVTFNGVSSANFGDASMFSFHATKVFNSIEGGALFFRDSELAIRLDELKNFGIHGPESVQWVGGNAKMNEFAAAMGVCNLRHLDEEIAKRAKVSEQYHKRLDGVKGIRLNTTQEGVKPNYAYFPVVFDGYKYTRDEIFEMLKAENIVARKYFYPLVNSFDCYKSSDFYGTEKTPVAKYISDRVLTLPMYAELSSEDVDRICDIILK